MNQQINSTQRSPPWEADSRWACPIFYGFLRRIAVLTQLSSVLFESG